MFDSSAPPCETLSGGASTCRIEHCISSNTALPSTTRPRSKSPRILLPNAIRKLVASASSPRQLNPRFALGGFSRTHSPSNLYLCGGLGTRNGDPVLYATFCANKLRPMSRGTTGVRIHVLCQAASGPVSQPPKTALSKQSSIQRGTRHVSRYMGGELSAQVVKMPSTAFRLDTIGGSVPGTEMFRVESVDHQYMLCNAMRAVAYACGGYEAPGDMTGRGKSRSGEKDPRCVVR